MKAVHDRHVEGLFARATWLEVLAGAGYLTEIAERPLDDVSAGEVFLCTRPAQLGRQGGSLRGPATSRARTDPAQSGS